MVFACCYLVTRVFLVVLHVAMQLLGCFEGLARCTWWILPIAIWLLRCSDGFCMLCGC